MEQTPWTEAAVYFVSSQSTQNFVAYVYNASTGVRILTRCKAKTQFPAWELCPPSSTDPTETDERKIRKKGNKKQRRSENTN